MVRVMVRVETELHLKNHVAYQSLANFQVHGWGMIRARIRFTFRFTVGV